MRMPAAALSALAMALVGVGAPAFAQSQANTPPAPSATETDQNAAIMAFFAEYDAQQLALAPLSKSYRGIKDADYGRWGDFTDETEARANDAERSALREMRARFDPAKLSPETACRSDCSKSAPNEARPRSNLMITAMSSTK